MYRSPSQHTQVQHGRGEHEGVNYALGVSRVLGSRADPLIDPFIGCADYYGGLIVGISRRPIRSPFGVYDHVVHRIAERCEDPSGLISICPLHQELVETEVSALRGILPTHRTA